MIATAFAWIMGSKFGRTVAMIAAGIALALVVAWRLIARGESIQKQKQERADNAAVARAEVADREFRESGGARGKLKDGTF